MRKMKVYAHYEKINGIEYRWRTLLQLGNSWEVCSTVIMKNPGSSHPVNWKDDKPIPINDIEILERNGINYLEATNLESLIFMIEEALSEEENEELDSLNIKFIF